MPYEQLPDPCQWVVGKQADSCKVPFYKALERWLGGDGVPFAIS